MKPQQSNAEYCIEHKDWINGLLEKRGGWERGDRYTYAEYLEEDRTDIWHLAHQPGDPRHGAIWLPSADDVLAILDEWKYMPALESSIRIDQANLIWMAYAGRFNSGWHDTPLIALLELLRAVEGKG